ncbi:MAG: hypothetical protein ACRYGK_00810 [Janthinobacterium lividum]
MPLPLIFGGVSALGGLASLANNGADLLSKVKPGAEEEQPADPADMT